MYSVLTDGYIEELQIWNAIPGHPFTSFSQRARVLPTHPPSHGAVFLLHCSVSLAEASGKTLPLSKLSKHTWSCPGSLDVLLCWQSAVQKTISSGKIGVWK